MPTSLALWHGQCWYRQHPSWREFNYLFRLYQGGGENATRGCTGMCFIHLALDREQMWDSLAELTQTLAHLHSLLPLCPACSLQSLSTQAHPAVHSISSPQGTAIGGALCWTQHYYRREQAQPLTLGKNTGEVAAEATVRPRDTEASWAAWVAKLPGTGPLGGCDLRLEQVPCTEQVHVGCGASSSSACWASCFMLPFLKSYTNIQAFVNLDIFCLIFAFFLIFIDFLYAGDIR